MRSESPACGLRSDPLVTLGALTSAPISDHDVFIPVGRDSLPALAGDVCVKLFERHRMINKVSDGIRISLARNYKYLKSMNRHLC